MSSSTIDGPVENDSISVEPTGADSGPRHARIKEGRSVLSIATVAVVIAIGLAERIILLRHNSLQPDADESMSGLMAQNLLRHNPETFLWGQPYGGAAEIWPVALMVKIFGPSLFAMRAFTIALGAVVPFLMWRVASRLMKPSAAVVAGLVMWIYPVAFISWSLREYLYYTPVLTLGLLGILFAQRSTEQTKRWIDPVGIGICMGIGWWISPFIAYFGLFVVLTLVRSKTYLLRRSWITIAGFLLGAAPWIAYNVPRDFISLKTPAGATGGPYVDHLHYLAQPGLAVAFGLKGWYSKIWPFDNMRSLGHIMLFAMCVIGGAVALWALAKWARRKAPMPTDVICLIAWPFFYALSPMTGSNDLWVPRYFFFLWPFMAFVIGRLATTRRLIPVVMIGVVGLAGIGLNDQVKRVNDWPYTGDLRHAAEAHGVTYMFSSYWVAYKIDYETNGKIIADPAFPASVRYKPYDIQVRQSNNPAWVFRKGDQREARFITATQKMGMNLQPIAAGAYDLFLPERKILPEDVPGDVLIDPSEGV